MLQKLRSKKIPVEMEILVGWVAATLALNSQLPFGRCDHVVPPTSASNQLKLPQPRSYPPLGGWGLENILGNYVKSFIPFNGSDLARGHQ